MGTEAADKRTGFSRAYFLPASNLDCSKTCKWLHKESHSKSSHRAFSRPVAGSGGELGSARALGARRGRGAGKSPPKGWMVIRHPATDSLAQECEPRLLSNSVGQPSSGLSWHEFSQCARSYCISDTAHRPFKLDKCQLSSPGRHFCWFTSQFLTY